jgi:hypothetical protein
MCIVCNCDEAGLRFLDHFHNARAEMEQATRAMLICAGTRPEYDATHKRMVRLCRDWNRIEHEREPKQ